MLVPFEKMPPYSRIWIYQADGPLSSGNLKILEDALTQFCQQWTAHEIPLQTAFRIEHGQFVIIAVDETVQGASGCSIDGSLRTLKEVQSKTNVNFFDRTRIAFLINNQVETFQFSEVKELFQTMKLLPSAITFNNLVDSKAAWEGQWKIPAEKSWLAKYLPKPALTS